MLKNFYEWNPLLWVDLEQTVDEVLILIGDCLFELYVPLHDLLADRSLIFTLEGRLAMHQFEK